MKCRNCLGKGEEFCPVCKGTKKDPRNEERTCGHCNGKGYVECNDCKGSGKDPYP